MRTLDKNKLKYKIIAAGPNDQIFCTKYKSEVIYAREKRELELDDLINGLRKIPKDRVNVVAPSTEALNRFLLDYRDDIEQEGFTVPLVDKKIYESISDKSKFAELCLENGIRIPQECVLSEKFEKALVAKPRKYVSQNGVVYAPVFIKNQEEQDAFAARHNVDDFYFQEYLDGGRSVYLLFYFEHGKEHAVLSQENYLQQPNGKSIQCAEVSDDYKNDVVVKPYVELFEKIGFRGLVMVELREVSGVYYMIEANPRFWGPSQLFCDAQYNLFEFFLHDYGLIRELPKQNLQNAYYFWSNGIPAKEIGTQGLTFHGEGKKILEKKMSKIKAVDIYDRQDTQGIFRIEHLKWLYTRTSKHSNYQILPDSLVGIIGDELPINSRYEKERLSYVEKRVNLRNKKVLDIGGNTGFFTIQSIMDGARELDYYEGNKTHAEFVETAADVLGLQQKIHVFPEYYDFEQNKKRHDVIFNLNVLHHMGDDFDAGKNKEQVKEDILDRINNMASMTDTMVFQLGFNWKGNPCEGLFDNGTKQEMIDYLENGTKNFWRISYIGIAIKEQDGKIIYKDVDKRNVRRDDALGEFLNRPIFIMESLK